MKNEKGFDFIWLSRFENLCFKHGLEEYEIKQISDIFHALGIFIHYYDDINLQNLIILNPEWATQGVYKVLDNYNIKTKNGRFTHEDLNQTWTETKFRYRKKELLALMKKFDLCFELKNGEEYLVPQLLSKQPLDYEWRTHKDNLFFEYRYEFMPKGIMSHFIVKRHGDIFKETYWLNGVLLEWNNTRAIVTEHYIDKKIRIILEGDSKKQFLVILNKSLKEIYHRFQNLQFEEYIGCICSECRKADSPYFHQLKNIRIAQRKNIKTIQCQQSFEHISLTELVNLVDELKDDGGLKGSFFESIIKELLQDIYPKFDIRHKVTLGKFEYDFVIIASDYNEIIIIETKGFHATKKIELGDHKTKETVKWFFGNTFPSAQENLKDIKSNPLFNYNIRACYITSGCFSDEASTYLEQMNQGNLKPSQLDIYYDRKKLISLLKNKGKSKLVDELVRFYG